MILKQTDRIITSSQAAAVLEEGGVIAYPPCIITGAIMPLRSSGYLI